MSTTLHFNDQAADRLLAVYVTPDMVAQRKQVLDVLQLQAGEKVLDIGSGPGFLASDMASIVGKKGEVCGIDISDELLSLATDKYAHQSQLKFQHAEANDLPFPENYFDAAVVTQVLEYLPDVDAVLLELHCVLRPGGRILIVDTDWDSIVWQSMNPARMKRILAAWDEHLFDPYLPRTLSGKLKATGFRVEEQRTISIFNPEFDENTFSNRMIDLIGVFVIGRQGITATEVDEWARELRQLGEQGSYFFSLNRYVFIASKA